MCLPRMDDKVIIDFAYDFLLFEYTISLNLGEQISEQHCNTWLYAVAEAGIFPFSKKIFENSE